MSTGTWPIFWISGLALFFVNLAGWVTDSKCETFEFFIYNMAGTVLPLSVLAIAIFQDRFVQVSRKLLLILTVIFWIVALRWSSIPDLISLALSLGQVFILKDLNLTRKEKYTAFAFNLLVWGFVRRLTWFDALWFHFSLLQSFTLLFSFALINICLFFPRIVDNLNLKFSLNKHAMNLGCLAILGLASWRVGLDFHHISFYTGTAELVRQGGTLLWDVPSQYGLLNVLLIALMPVKSIWQAFYIVNSLAIFFTVLITYSILQGVCKGNIGRLFAFLTTFSVLIILPGIAMDFNGANTFPSTGGLRFIWCYVLLFTVLLSEKKSENGVSQKNILFVGAAFWIFSFFWSAESAIYGTAIWFPYYILRCFWSNTGFVWNVKNLHKSIVNLAGLLLILSLSFASIFVFYQLKFGHPPDWLGYYEYAVAYKNGFCAILVDPRKAVWVMLLMFCSILSLLYKSWKSQQKGLLPGVASFFCFWIVSSYFVSRSHENNILNLIPILLISLIATFKSIQLDPIREIALNFYRSGFY